MLWLYVALGGAVGSLARYFLGASVQEWAGPGFPAGTLVVNVTASFLIGAIMQYSLESTAISLETRVLLTTGFCGGYSTFSTFSWETIRLMQGGQWGRAGLYIGGSLALSLGATVLGLVAGHHLVLVRRGG